ncbi:MAG: hypothetical protein ACN6ON_09425 [Sphingobacterium sp.]
MEGRDRMLRVRSIILTCILTLMLISGVEVFNILYFTQGELSPFGMGFLLGNFILLSVSSRVFLKLLVEIFRDR